MYLGILLHVISKMTFVVSSYAIHFALGRFLTEAQYGLIGTIITIINFEYIFFTDGVRQGMSKSISMRKYDEKDIIKTGLKFQIALIVVFFVATFGGAELMAGALGDPEMTKYIRGIALLIPFTGIYSLILGILNGHKFFQAEAGISTVYPLLKLSIIPFALVLFPDAVLGAEAGFLFAGVITMLLALATLLSYNKKRVVYNSSLKMPLKEYLQLTSGYMLLFCVSTVMMNLDTLILKSVSLDNAVVGYYTGVATFAKVPYFLLTAFYTVALPVITRHHAAGEKEQATAEIGNLLTVILVLILPIVTTVSAAAGSILSLFYKPSYWAGRDALSLLVFGISFLGMTLFFTMILSAADRKWFIIVLSIAMLIGQAFFCPLLTSVFSLTGTAGATLLVAGIGMLISAMYTRKVFGRYLNKKHMILIAFHMICFFLAVYFLHRTRLESFFLLVILCGLYYIVTAGAGLWISGMHKTIWEKVKTKGKRG